MRRTDDHKLALRACLLFALASLGWSLFGFFAPFPSRFGEYTPSSIITEVTGHVAFGLAAGAASLDLDLALTCGAMSILMDLDHLASALGFSVLSRTTHSIPFAVFAALALAYSSRPGRRKAMLAAVIAASVLAHLSYDTFGGGGAFPLLSPLSFAVYLFPSSSWLPLECAAALIAFLPRLAVGRMTTTRRPQE